MTMARDPRARTVATAGAGGRGQRVAIVLSFSLHGVVLAALFPGGETTPPLSLPALTVEIVGDPTHRSSPEAPVGRPGPDDAGATPWTGVAAKEKFPPADPLVDPLAETLSAAPPVPNRKPAAPPSWTKFAAPPQRTRPAAAIPIRLTVPAETKEPDAASGADAPSKLAKAGATAVMAPSPVGLGLGNPKPRYPRSARLRGHQGRVVLRVEVTLEGAAASVRVASSSGFSELDAAALRAVRRWRFAPARRAGVAVAGAVEVPIVFRLTDR